MYIKDRINEVREDFPWSAFEIINYHQFMSIALNNSGIKIEVPEHISSNSDLLDGYLENNYYSNLNVLDGKEIKNNYKTILIDEVQDYKPEWIKMIQKYFLTEDGEMILFGDEKQNLYKREVDSERKITVPNGFGRWEKLTKSYRYKESSLILSLARDFQSEFLSSLYEIDEDESIQDSLSLVGINAFEEYERSSSFDGNALSYNLIHLAVDMISLAKHNEIHPNDIVIVSSNINIIREVDYVIRRGEHREKTLTTFETKEMYSHAQYKKEVKNIRRAKKFGFNLNSGVVKLSTIHSFKGFESPTVCVLIEGSDSPELVYTALTRARQNIIVFCEKGSKYSSFFSERLTPLSSFL
jgi:superfamily I DNA/RNA helicase